MMTCLSVYSQQKQDDHAFRSGEALYYEVAYNWGIIWVNAGEVYFKVDTIVHENQPAYAFDSYGQSYSFYDWIFKVRDHFQSVALRESLQPVQFKRDTYEGGFEVNNTYQFLNKEQKVIAEIEHSDRPRTADTLDLPFGTLDVLTAIYHARNLNFDTLEPGEKIPVRFIIDGEFYELYIRYQGREVKKNRDGKLYRCIKFSALLVEGTIFKGGEDLVVWVTDDENKVPVMAEARILVGSIKAYLTGFENLKGKMPEVEKE
ncbi:MAG: DUF3108 domain-containing protein [Bacteroidetes bacterium]|nr:DUF3108 domain-containing protein [Bacteroidota bacterium]